MVKAKQKRSNANKSAGGGNSGGVVNSKQASGSIGGGGGFPPRLLHSRGHCNSSNTSDELVETLVPNAVFVARQALSSNECREWIKYAEEGSRWDEVSHPASKWIAHRECGRIQKNDWNMSHRLYQRIEKVVRKAHAEMNIFDKAALYSSTNYYAPFGISSQANKSDNPPKYQPVSCNPNLRLYKYTKGQWFGRHVDDSNKIEFPIGGKDAPFSEADVKEAQTEITVLFYLSSCRGGATRFHLPNGKSNGKKMKTGIEGVAFEPEEGAVLLHVHGDHCLEHEAEPVLDGVKYGKSYEEVGQFRLRVLFYFLVSCLRSFFDYETVLRTDIVYGIL
ncbi:hypothetical protein ACHAWF_006124 [Thalassiosira exigua]